jgi:hypothetical protein
MTMATTKRVKVLVDLTISSSMSFSPMDLAIPVSWAPIMDSRLETYTHLAVTVAPRLDKMRREQAKRKIFFFMDMFLSLSMKASTVCRSLPMIVL